MITRILWVTAGLNHYKARFLNHLASEKDIDLVLLTGKGRENMGDQEIHEQFSFEHIKVNVSKKNFGRSKIVNQELKAIFGNFHWVLIPAEKKNIALFLYATKLRKYNINVRLFSYNHPVLKSGKGKSTLLDKWITKFYYRTLDRVIFYTEHSCKWALKQGFVSKGKAYWANNTVDNTEIKKYYTYQLPPKNSISILFIGRLIQSKRIPDLMRYYSKLKEDIPNLKLEIIGDGPESSIVAPSAKLDESISWHGTLINEVDIAPIMKRASLVFIPGHSGLSVNHAFAYGRPYITLQGPSHAPELDYLDESENGYVLDGDFESNINKITALLSNRSELERFCNSAKQKGEYLSVLKWVKQMKQSLINDY